MPYRSFGTLERWIDEFDRLGYGLAGEIRVIQQDGAAGADTGLVSVLLAHSGTVVTLQPEQRDAVRWLITMEPREESVTLDAPELISHAADLAVVSALCAFLQAKSLAAVEIEES